MRCLIPALVLAYGMLAQAALAQQALPPDGQEVSKGRRVRPLVGQGASIAPGKPLPPPPKPSDPKFASIDVEPGIKGDQLARCRQAADAMARASLSPPEARMEHFGWLKTYPASEYRGWHGFVTKVEPIEGGCIATVRVGAKLAMCCCSDYVIERYSIIDGEVRFKDGDFGPVPGGTFLFGH
jgi:hypothetical protein